VLSDLGLPVLITTEYMLRRQNMAIAHHRLDLAAATIRSIARLAEDSE